MQINTLWKKPHENEAAELVDAVDEYTIEANDGYPKDYAEKLKETGVRELIIEVPDNVIDKLFKTPIVSATIVTEE